jgi:hypothetical protein
MPERSIPTSWLLLLIGAAMARLWMQAAALPPYAGLDEVFHVARLSFVAQEGRNPGMREKSVPRYLERSIIGEPAALPAFGVVGPEWPRVVNTRKVLTDAPLLTRSEVVPYARSNYEAQQPSLYYTVVAPLVHLLPQRTALGELQLWRAVSVLFAVFVVVATAITVSRFQGAASGVIAALLLLSLPTWQTVIVRASNDALACAFLAGAYAMTFANREGRRWWVAEAVLWALALATKLYAWPAAVMLPLVWHYQKAPRARRWLVLACGAVSVLLTIVDLGSRTNNPLGLFMFDPTSATTTATTTIPAVPIDYGAMIRITIASGAWASGQHWNALTPLATLLYFGPVLLLIAPWIVRRRAESKLLLAACVTTVAAFAFAQIVTAAAYIRKAHEAGLALPAGGKEGWYWYTLATLFVCALFGMPARYAPAWVISLLTVWVVGWDVLIHEGALFQDFAGITSPAHGDALFRWGPRALPFTADLTHVGVGPGTTWLLHLRLAELLLLSALTVIAIRSRRRVA